MRACNLDLRALRVAHILFLKEKEFVDSQIPFKIHRYTLSAAVS